MSSTHVTSSMPLEEWACDAAQIRAGEVLHWLAAASWSRCGVVDFIIYDIWEVHDAPPFFVSLVE